MKPGKIELHVLRQRILCGGSTRKAVLVIKYTSDRGVGPEAVGSLRVDQVPPVAAEKNIV